MDDDGGMDKSNRDDGTGTSGAAKNIAHVSEDDDSSSAEAEFPVSSTEAFMIGEAIQPLVEGDEKDPASSSAVNVSDAAAPSHGNRLETLDLISTIGTAGGSSGAVAQGMCSTAFAGAGPIVQAPARAAPNIPVTVWGVRCPHCGVGTATMKAEPAQRVCLCHACRTDVDAACPVCGLRGFFPCPGSGAGVEAATRMKPFPVRHHCLCEACLNDDHSVCLVCGAGGPGALGLHH